MTMVYAVRAFSLAPVAQFVYLSDASVFAKTMSATLGAVKHAVEWSVVQIAFDEDEKTMLDDGTVETYMCGENTFACWAHHGDVDAAINAYASRSLD